MSSQKLNDIVKRNKCIWIRAPSKPFHEDFIKVKQLSNTSKYGVTYQCKRKQDDKLFAVKYLNKHRLFYRINVNHRHRYLKAVTDEIDVIKTLNHNLIIKLEDVYEDKLRLYVIMEECKGGDLLKRICQQKRLSEKQAANIIKQLLSALKYMHDDNCIVHCALKPEKILFVNNNQDSPIKIIDFGMSKVLPRLQYLTYLSGTPYYTAPEIIKNRKYNHSCDMWSVGVILYLIIYGYSPFYVDPQHYGENERHLIYRKIVKGFEPKIKETSIYGYGPWFPDHIKTSPEVKDLISKLLQRSVRKRYTAKEALCHPWIANLKNNDDIDLRKDSVSRLFRFHNVCQYKQVIIKILRNQYYKMRIEDFYQLQQLFIKFDKNNDGIICNQQFESAVNAMDINIDITKLNQTYMLLLSSNCAQFIVPYWFRQISKHQFISINNITPIIQQYFCDLVDITFCNVKSVKVGIKFADLLNVLVYDYLISCDQRLYDAFRILDDDNDRKITTKQLKQKLKEMDSLREWDKAIKLIEEESFDQNGIINYEEFLLNLHPNFEEISSWIPDLFKKMPSVFSVKQKSKISIGGGDIKRGKKRQESKCRNR